MPFVVLYLALFIGARQPSITAYCRNKFFVTLWKETGKFSWVYTTEGRASGPICAGQRTIPVSQLWLCSLGHNILDTRLGGKDDTDA